MSQTPAKPPRGSRPGTPRWVKVIVIIFGVLVLLLVTLHLSGFGFGGHSPFAGYWTYLS